MITKTWLVVVAAAISLATAETWASDAAKTVTLFNGEDLSAWNLIGGKGTNQWVFGQAALNPADASKLIRTGPGTELISPSGGANLSSQAAFGDCHLEVEFMVPQHSNSGIKLMDIYEIQILDSYGKPTPGKGDCGAIYQETAPSVNAAKPAGEWQTLVIDFQAPRFDAAGAKTANAKFVKVLLNGQTIHQNVEVAHGTNVGRNKKEQPKGPIYLQGDHGSIAFRNLRVTPRE